MYTDIKQTDYIGDSLVIINSNFNNINTDIQNLLTKTAKLSAAFDTRVVGITSIDNCGPYSAFFSETFPTNISFGELKLTYLYSGQNPIQRKLNTVNYNTTINGDNTTSTIGYYRLDTSTGYITIPRGIYDINAGCSGTLCKSHTANIITFNTATPANKTVLLYGSSEYSPSNVFSASSNVKMRGRVVFPNDNNVIYINHLFASPSTGYIGHPLGSEQSFTQYFAYVHIQKIKSL
jgi:hypothetical protein